MRQAQEHTMAESLLHLLVPSFWGAFFGEGKFLPWRTVHSSMLSTKGGRRGISWGIPAACLCPSRPAGSLHESTGTLHSAPQPGLQLAFLCLLQRGVTSSAATQSSSLLQKAPGESRGLGECFCCSLYLLPISIPAVVRSTLPTRTSPFPSRAEF